MKNVNDRSEDNYIGLEEAAEYLDIKPITLRRWLKSKPDLPKYQIGKLWKFKKSELDVWVQNVQSQSN